MSALNYRFLTGENISLTTSIVTLKSLISGTAFQQTTRRVLIANCTNPLADPQVYIYASAHGSAPDAVTKMIPIAPGQIMPFEYAGTDLDNVYVAGGASCTPLVIQEGTYP
jgi:hypothetical protein